MIPKALLTDLRRFGYERTEAGIFIPSAGVTLSGQFDISQVRKGEVVDQWSQKNLVVDVGINHFLNVAVNDATAKISTWYVGIFKSNYTPVAADTLATLLSNATEAVAATDYNEATRQAYVETAATAKSLTNSASPATFTCKAAFTAYGAFLCSVNSTATGILLAAKKFGTARALEITDQLLVTYTISAS